MKIMHTMASEARTKVPKRRFYSPELKLQIVGQCAQPGASIAAVALKHGVNANIVHRWLREHSQGTLTVQPLGFVPVTLAAQPAQQSPLSAPSTPPDIRIEVHLANTTIVVNWPLQGGAACAQWLREWLA
jgi:transposase